MQLFHLSVKPVKRSDGRSIVAAAAYRAGKKLNDKKYGVVHDYSRKQGVVYSEIMLPSNAPSSFSNREKLWNEVEQVEKSSVARVGREIEISFPYEFDRETSIRLIREYVKTNFVDQGMCADINIHDPHKKKTRNPHVHVLLTTRALGENGDWLAKKKKDYILDRDGNKQYDRIKKSYKFRTVSTTDWDRKEKVEEWRENWYKSCLQEFHRMGIVPENFDHRSHERRRLLLSPVPNMPMAACQMEAKGIRTEAGDRKREVVSTNQIYIQDFKNLLERVDVLEQAQGQDRLVHLEADDARQNAPVVLYSADQALDQLVEKEAETAKSELTEVSRPADEPKRETLADLAGHYVRLEAKYARWESQANDLSGQIRRQKNRLESFDERTKELFAIRQRIGELEAKKRSLPVFDLKGRKEIDQVLEQLTMRANRSDKAIRRSFRMNDLEGAGAITPDVAQGKMAEYQQGIEQLEKQYAELPDFEKLKAEKLAAKQRVLIHAKENPREIQTLEKPSLTVQHHREERISMHEQIAAQEAQRQLYREVGYQEELEERRKQKLSRSRGM